MKSCHTINKRDLSLVLENGFCYELVLIPPTALVLGLKMAVKTNKYIFADKVSGCLVVSQLPLNKYMSISCFLNIMTGLKHTVMFIPHSLIH